MYIPELIGKSAVFHCEQFRILQSVCRSYQIGGVEILVRREYLEECPTTVNNAPSERSPSVIVFHIYQIFRCENSVFIASQIE